MWKRKVASLLAVGALTISLAACGDDSEDKSSSDDKAAPSASSSAAVNFGAGCAAVPPAGEKGSFEGMSKDPVGTAASTNPLLSTLVTAVTEAGLVDTLNTAEALTV
ncbi:MAG: fasciclin domain-containing protein, partial [Mycobacteriales bacterium]